jgi:tRNA pseudouridine13 synthase
MIESKLNLELPYITNELAGIGGRLRASPDHFVVEEIPLYEPSGEGQHLYFRLTKSELTTKEVQNSLGILFGVRRGDVGFAGMKDKYARTTQLFSVNVGPKGDAFAAEAIERVQAELPVEVHWAAFHRNKLRTGHLIGNRFSITITDLAVPPLEALQRAEAIGAAIVQRGIPNFFGPQRLGPNGVNVRQGIDLLVNRRHKRDRWLQKFLVSCYQSYLCNRYLSVRVEQGLFTKILEGDVAKKYATGGMFDVEDQAAEQLRYEAGEISFTAPLYGSKMWPAKAEAGNLEAAILEGAPAGLADFERARVEGTRRLGRLRLLDLTIEPAVDGLLASFSLPKGAFATTVLRELMKVEATDLGEDDDEEFDESLHG